jgi:hypothetical protein
VSLLAAASGVRRDTGRKGYPFRREMRSSFLDSRFSCATFLIMAALPNCCEPTAPCISTSGLV